MQENGQQGSRLMRFPVGRFSNSSLRACAVGVCAKECNMIGVECPVETVSFAYDFAAFSVSGP